MNYYNEISKGYEELHKEEQLKKIKIIKDNLVVSKDDLLLDLGCGPGFAEFGCETIGIDPSSELLKKCKFETHCCCAEDLPFEDNKFDIIVSITAIQNFNDVEKALSEVKRVGKDKIVISCLKKSSKLVLVDELLKKYFKVDKVIEEEKDMIYFMRRS